MARRGTRSTPLGGGRRRAIAVVVVVLAAVAAAVLGRGAFAAPASPLSVVKSASVSSVASGGQLTYTIVIKNTGGASVSNAVLTDQVNGIGVIQNPPALPQLQITSTSGSCTQGGPNGNLVTCNGGALAGGASWTVTIGGQVTAGSGTTLNNTASVSATKTSQSFTTLSNAVSVPVTGSTGGNLPDLTINKTGPTSVTPGGPITYTLTVNNIGSANATGVKVVDTVPAGVGSITASGTSLFNCNVASQTVTCTGGAVNQGQNATITINGIVTASGGTLTNTTVVDPDNTIVESNEQNNTSATVNTSVGGPPPPALLEIKKTDGSPTPTVTPGDPPLWWVGAGPDPVNPGQKLTYKILVVNEATGNNPTAGSLVVTDATQGLDASSIVASESIVNGTVAKTDGCTVAASQVSCTVKTLGSLGTIAITISGNVLQSAGSSIFNSATVTGNIRNQGVTSTATETTTVRPKVDLTVTDDDSPDPVCAHSWPVDSPNQHLSTPPNTLSAASGHPAPLLQPADCLGGLTYSLVVGNSGISTASGVEVRDPLPAGAIFDSYQDVDHAGFTCTLQTGNVVDCTGGTIGAASIVHLNLLVVAPPNVGSITNVVTVDPNNTIFESDETNNTVSQTTQVTTGVDLVVWKGHATGVVPPGSPTYKTLTEGFDPVATNGTETYTIYVDNVGTQDTTGVKVVDTLPAGTKFLSAKGDQGFSCSSDGSATGGNVTCVGAHLRGTESEFYTAPGGAVPAGEDHATITIKVFATPNVQPAMHNEVRVDPDNTIPEVNEDNNLWTDDVQVTTGNDDKGAFNQLTIAKTQFSPSGGGTVATNGKVTYDLEVSNLGTDPVSNVVVKDTLPTGTRFISAKDLDATHGARFFCSHDGSPTGGVVTCTGGDFSGSVNTVPDSPSGTVPITRHIRITVFAPNVAGTYTNHATVDPDNVVPEGNEFDNDSSVDTTVAPCVGLTQCTSENAFNELTITKTQASPANPGNEVARNGVITYNLKVENLGSDPAQGVVATDHLPAGFRFISAKDLNNGDPEAFTCGGPDGSGVVTCSGGSLSGTVNALPSGAPTSRTIVVRVFAPDTPGTYPNLAFVDPNNAIPEGNEFNNQSSVETKVENGGPGPYIDLNLVKTQEPVLDQDQPGGTGTPVRVAPGGPIKYVLTVNNLATGPDAGDAFNVTVRDTLPANVTFFSAADEAGGPGNFACGQEAGQPNTINCTGGTILAGGSRKIDIFAVAPTNLANIASDKSNIQETLTNTAMVDPDNAIPEGDETNNVSSVKTLVQSEINLSLTKDGPGSASQNQTTTYTIKVTNNKVWGNGQTAFDTTIVDPLPTGLIPLNVEADPGNFQCQILENPVNTVTCTGDLATGQSVTVTISAFVTLESGTLDNEACVNTHFTPTTVDETDLTDNCNHAITGVTPPTPDIQINKTADKNSVTAGQKLNYNLNVSNVGTGPTDGTPVVVTDNVPSDVTVDQVVPPAGWDCSATSGNNVSCQTTAMNPGDSADIGVDTTVGSPTAPFTNEADVSGGGDTQTNNNKSTVTTQVGTASAIDLQVVSLTDQTDPVNRSDQETYTAVVTNNGTSPANNAVVRVKLPNPGSSNPTVNASNGFNCVANTTVDSSGDTFDCTGTFDASGGANASTTITASITVDPGAPEQLEATVIADPDNAITESDETNNTKSEQTSVTGSECTAISCVDLVSSVFGDPIVFSNVGLINYSATVANIGTSAVSDSPAWTIEVTYIGIGVPTITAPAGVTCTPTGLDVWDCKSAGGSPDPMALAPAAGLTFLVTVTGATVPGVAILEVNADSTGVVTEFSESNNEGIWSTVIMPPPGP